MLLRDSGVATKSGVMCQEQHLMRAVDGQALLVL